MLLTPLALTPDHDIPGPLLTELTALYASDHAFQALSGDFPEPGDIRPEQVAAALAEELAHPDAEVLLARSAGRLVGVVITLARHPDPADPDPWIGLLIVDAAVQGQGHGRRIAERVEARFRQAGRTAVRLAVLDANPKGLAFWTALGYEVIAHRPDLQHGRPCTVLRKRLRTPRAAARIAVVDPEGAVFLFRYDNVEVGVHWALPGGGLEPGESPQEGALRELREETGWTDLAPGPLLCTWEHDFTHSGVPVHQHEHVYVTEGPRREPTGPHLAAAHATDGILTWRWWTREELRNAPEPVWPPDLARLLDRRDGTT
ncbi:bifunctional GNAT family N-acetyltransferase/NUDIX hydrolase [Streptomyces antibioticus]|uniref:DNA mismatch repair protein MutT n=1 Tax=Streptomyces antibioticus TaxID=1890 RepID=A0AAE6Y8G4_STRAT|nr:bifunctional GNAT family N-acetyltransferase/NUDIX hydrolase [Streptomyces antibioticus]OOQ51101.1 DNA mismatch repair protein MutT [Streptomyces antibioticus]QIT45258.1 GNAT family N-acetyltransferase [Streptomyces antibioticus]